MSDKCLHCDNTGYVHTEDDIPDQMCPNCEIGQAVIKGYNKARDIGIQACETLEATKNKRIIEIEELYEAATKALNSQIEINEKIQTENKLLKKEVAEWQETVESQHWEKEQYKKALERNKIDVEQALKA